MNSKLVAYLAVACSLTGVRWVDAATLYAKKTGLTSGACDSWGNACTLEQALLVAVLGDSVWVQAETYGPISLPNGVKIIGGFGVEGTETLASQSNPAVNVTTISGGDDERCVTSESNAPETVLRGFRIANGYRGNDISQDDCGGGGLFLKNSSAVFVQCVFEDNKAMWFGAAVAIQGSSSAPHFVNCTFRNNGNGSAGAALDNNVEPLAGGAVYLHSGSPTFVNCLFHDNKAGEGAVLANASGTPTLVNCTLAKNYAKIGYGGGLHDRAGKALLRNCIAWDNTAVKDGDQIMNSAYGVTPVTYTDVQGGWSGAGNMNTNPLFVNSDNSNFRLQSGSPCINAGKHVNPSLPYDLGDLDWDNVTSVVIPLDLDGLARRVNLKVDLGAYERPSGTLPPGYE